MLAWDFIKVFISENIPDLESGGQDHLFFFLRGRVDEQSRRFHQITFAHEAVFLGVNLATIFHGSQNCEERMNQKKRRDKGTMLSIQKV